MAEKLVHRKVVTLLLIVGAVYFFLKYLTPLFGPILTAMLFVTIFGPTLKKMQEKLRIHRQVGAVLLLLVFCTVVGVLLWVLFSWGAGSLPVLVEKLDLFEKQAAQVVEEICKTVEKTLKIDGGYLESLLLEHLENGVDYLQQDLLPGMLSQSLVYMKAVASAAAYLLTFLIAAVLLAKDYDRIMNRLLDREEFHVLLEVICGIIRYIATFVRAQAVIMGAIAALSAVVLQFAGIRYGALWGILAGVLDALPFVGTGIVLLPLTAVQFFYGSVGRAAVCLILFVCCTFLREILEPRLIGSRIGISPITVLASVYAGIHLFGLFGIIKGPLGFMIANQIWKSLQRRGGMRDAG